MDCIKRDMSSELDQVAHKVSILHYFKKANEIRQWIISTDNKIYKGDYIKKDIGKTQVYYLRKDNRIR